ncbi:hypothetical protein BDF14DRAFT_1742413 [Spinellus fusiger]|nr:hypothetical protein BDF14DRAFT_1742413 [Spinellus fusiger]
MYGKKTTVFDYKTLSSLYVWLCIDFRGAMLYFGPQHEEVYSDKNLSKSTLTHKTVGGAAAYDAVKEYGRHCHIRGKPAELPEAKQLLTNFSASAVDKIFETKGLDYLDKQKAKQSAEDQVLDFYEKEILSGKCTGMCPQPE